MTDFGILTPLLDDHEITDIRCTRYDCIRYKNKGKLIAPAGIVFSSPGEYKDFISGILEQSHVAVNKDHAVFYFGVWRGDYYLKISCSLMPVVDDCPYIFIRKIYNPENAPAANSSIGEGETT